MAFRLLISGLFFLLTGCLGGTPGVQGIEDLYNQGQDIKSAYNMNSSDAADLENQVNLLIAQLGRMVGIPPTTLYSGGNANKAYAISNSIVSAATMLVGNSSLPVVNNDTMNSLRVQILGNAASMPTNFGIQNAWNMMQFDLISEFISLQASYLSLVPQYMLQLLPYLSKDDMKKMKNTLTAVTNQLQQGMATS
jgi:hypothetical protein